MPLTPGRSSTRARAPVRLLLFDVDGVLTDGIGASSRATAARRSRFRSATARRSCGRSARDSRSGSLSGRPSEATTRRAAELGIDLVVQRGPDKRAAVRADARGTRADATDQVGVHGRRPAGPAGARHGSGSRRRRPTRADEVSSRVHWVSRAAGGRGAVREFIELVLRARGALGRARRAADLD